MLKLLRVIEAPQEFRIAGSWIAASLLDQVADYRTMVSTARRHIESMEETARAELEVQRTTVLKNAADGCREDLIQISKAFERRQKELEENVADACIEVTRLAVDEMIRNLPEKQRIEPLVSSLMARVKSRVSLVIKANPAQVDLVQELIAAKLADKFGLSSWSVLADPSVKIDRFVVDADGNSYIDVSLDNWLNLMAHEIESLRTYFESKSNSAQGKS